LAGLRLPLDDRVAALRTAIGPSLRLARLRAHLDAGVPRVLVLTDADAHKLLGLADRFERASLASHRDPERPFVERDELARELRQHLYEMRRRVQPAERGQIRPGSIEVAGRRVQVERR
jgi:hypothetical protein